MVVSHFRCNTANKCVRLEINILGEPEKIPCLVDKPEIAVGSCFGKF